MPRLGTKQSWGDLNDVTVSLTGQEISSSMGIEGWGNNTYGQGAWGEFAITIGLSPNFDISGVEFSAHKVQYQFLALQS